MDMEETIRLRAEEEMTSSLEEKEQMSLMVDLVRIRFMEMEEMTRSHQMELEMLSLQEKEITQLLLVAMLMEESSPQGMEMIVM